jgi:hypothetical protein
MIRDDDFLNLDLDSQNKFLVNFAENALPILSNYANVYHICEDSLQLIKKYMKDNNVSAIDTGIYLNHPDPDLDLSVQICFVDSDENAIMAIGIIAYATGVIARKAYIDQNIKGIPDPILMAEPIEVVSALGLYRSLLDKGLVPDV